MRRYDVLSRVYALNAALGSKTSLDAIARLGVRPGSTVLELAAGTGRDAVRLARLAGPAGTVLALDFSRGMLRQAAALARRKSAARVRLMRADAARIPLRNDSVDLVFCSRLLDLIDTPLIPGIVEECWRVLVPGGGIAFVNMSKRDGSTTWFERLYSRLRGFAGLAFASRPVLAAAFLETAGFVAIFRMYRRGFPCGSEVVLGRKASAPGS